MLWRRFYRATLWCSFTLVSSVLWFLLLEPFFRTFMVHNREHPTVVALRQRLFPEEWGFSTSQKGRFRVLVPGGYLNYKQIPIFLRDHSGTMHFYQSIRPNPISYTIGYCELPKNLQTPLFLQEFSEYAIASAEGKLIQTQTLKFQNNNIRENIVQMKLPGTDTIVSSRQRLWIRYKRLYQMIVITPTREASRQESDRFMDSLEFLP